MQTQTSITVSKRTPVSAFRPAGRTERSRAAQAEGWQQPFQENVSCGSPEGDLGFSPPFSLAGATGRHPCSDGPRGGSDASRIGSSARCGYSPPPALPLHPSPQRGPAHHLPALSPHWPLGVTRGSVDWLQNAGLAAQRRRGRSGSGR